LLNADPDPDPTCRIYGKCYVNNNTNKQFFTNFIDFYTFMTNYLAFCFVFSSF
jgi:hypothetical protein